MAENLEIDSRRRTSFGTLDGIARKIACLLIYINVRGAVRQIMIPIGQFDGLNGTYLHAQTAFDASIQKIFFVDRARRSQYAGFLYTAFVFEKTGGTSHHCQRHNGRSTCFEELPSVGFGLNRHITDFFWRVVF
jgi:hypothetical protein